MHCLFGSLLIAHIEYTIDWEIFVVKTFLYGVAGDIKCMILLTLVRYGVVCPNRKIYCMKYFDTKFMVTKSTCMLCPICTYILETYHLYELKRVPH